MRLADIAQAEFAAELDPARRHTITVAEWQNTAIYWGPWTLGEQAKCHQSPDWRGMGLAAQMVRVLRVKARDEKGNPLVDEREEEQFLTTARPEIVARVALGIMSSLTVTTTENAEKKSAATEASATGSTSPGA